VHLLGYRTDVPALLAAVDLVVHPARYEAYGLAVHEALCCGVPAIVTASAGVAARYSPDIRHLLLGDPDSSAELGRCLRQWRDTAEDTREHVLALSHILRRRTWDDMARDFVAAVAR
jgi:glycosyltransferase involved in cell wall biosynthesis